MSFVLIVVRKWMVKTMDRAIDCNNCCHLNISEKEQNKLKTKGKIEPHICLKFSKRVLHNANTKAHDPYLYPCTECVAERNRKEEQK